MERVFKSVGLVARYDKKQALELVEEIAEYLKSENVRVYIEDTLAGKVNTQGEMVPLTKMKTDFVENMNNGLQVKAAFDSLYKTVSRLVSLKEKQGLSAEDSKEALVKLKAIDYVLQAIF